MLTQDEDISQAPIPDKELQATNNQGKGELASPKDESSNYLSKTKWSAVKSHEILHRLYL